MVQILVTYQLTAFAKISTLRDILPQLVAEISEDIFPEQVSIAFRIAGVHDKLAHDLEITLLVARTFFWTMQAEQLSQKIAEVLGKKVGFGLALLPFDGAYLSTPACNDIELTVHLDVPKALPEPFQLGTLILAQEETVVSVMAFISPFTDEVISYKFQQDRHRVGMAILELVKRKGEWIGLDQLAKLTDRLRAHQSLADFTNTLHRIHEKIREAVWRAKDPLTQEYRFCMNPQHVIQVYRTETCTGHYWAKDLINKVIQEIHGSTSGVLE